MAKNQHVINMEKKYRVNRIFYSVQGEGARVGTPQVFIRFSGCNLRCSFCDTDHRSYTEMNVEEIIDECRSVGGGCHSISLCGGEPTLQVDDTLVSSLKDAGYYLSIETNGLLPVPHGIDYIVCSPKTDKIAPVNIDELRYVVKKGDTIPEPRRQAKAYFLSPCFNGDNADIDNINYCISLVKQHPNWRLGMQMQWHKFINIE